MAHAVDSFQNIVVHNDTEELVKFLQKKREDFDINQLVLSYFTALHFAIKCQNLAIAKILIENGANVNLKTKNGDNCLHLAMKSGNLNTIDFLLQYIDSNSLYEVNNDGVDCIAIAKINNKYDVIVFFIQKVNGFKEKNKSLLNDFLYKAIKDKNESSIRLLLSHGADPNYRDESCKYSFFLHLLRYFPKDDLIDLFFEQGADLQAINNQNVLHCAMRNDVSIETFEKLLKKNANVHKTDEYGYTPLHTLMTITSYDTEIVLTKIRLLLDFGADINGKLNDLETPQMTPLFIAVSNQLTKTIRYLLSLGANPNGCGESGHILIEALSVKNIEIVKCLIDHGAKLDLVFDRFEIGPLRYAIKEFDDEQTCCEVIKLFLEYGANIHEVDRRGFSVVHTALSKKRLQLFKFLVEQGAPVNLKDKLQRSPLFVAVQYDLYEAAEILIDMGLAVNDSMKYKIADGRFIKFSILCKAVENGNEEMTKLLLRNGATAYDFRALDHACGSGQVNLMKLLIASCAVNDPKINVGRGLVDTAIFHKKPEMVGYLLKLNNYDYFCNHQYLMENFNFLSVFRFNPDDADCLRTFLIVMKYLAVAMLSRFPCSLKEDNFITVSRIWAECRGKDYMTELVKMKKLKVHDQYSTTYYDVLTKNEFALARLLRAESVNATLRSCNLEDKFEYYHEDLKDNYLRGLEFLRKITKFRTVLQDIFGKFFFSDVTDMISQFYNDHDFYICLPNNGSTPK